jgi:hypothetical protein
VSEDDKVHVTPVLKAVLDMNLAMEQLTPEERQEALRDLRDYWNDPENINRPPNTWTDGTPQL